MKIKSNNFSQNFAKNFAFIDSQNLNLTIRKQNWQLDYRKFYIYLKHTFRVSKAFIFIGYIPENEKLYSFLQNIGYELIFKPTSRIGDGKIKGNVDAELVLHTMIEYDNYDKAVIVSNDGDFYCLVKYLFENDKLEKLAVPGQYSYSSLYREFLSKGKLKFIDKDRNKLGFRQ